MGARSTLKAANFHKISDTAAKLMRKAATIIQTMSNELLAAMTFKNNTDAPAGDVDVPVAGEIPNGLEEQFSCSGHL